MIDISAINKDLVNIEKTIFGLVLKFSSVYKENGELEELKARDFNNDLLRELFTGFRNVDFCFPSLTEKYTDDLEILRFIMVLENEAIEKSSFLFMVQRLQKENSQAKIKEKILELIDSGEYNPIAAKSIIDKYSVHETAASVQFFNTVETKHRSWFWYPFFRQGKVNTLTALQGTGKSTLCCYLAAMSSRGKRSELPLHDLWENQPHPTHAPETTLLLNAEDDPSEDMKERLEACGADLSKIAFVPTKDLNVNFYSPEIENWIKEVNPTLLVFDPVQQFFSGKDMDGIKLDMNSSQSVRPVMTHLKHLAEKYNLCIVLVCHPNKLSGNSALHSTMGSNDFTAAPRSALYIGVNPDDEKQRIITHLKSNNVKDEHKKSLIYEMDYRNGGVVWLGESDYKADEVKNGKSKEEKENKTNAEEFLDGLFENRNRILLSEILELASEQGISRATLYRAKKKLDYIQSTTNGANKIVSWYTELEDFKNAI